MLLSGVSGADSKRGCKSRDFSLKLQEMA